MNRMRSPQMHRNGATLFLNANCNKNTNSRGTHNIGSRQRRGRRRIQCGRRIERERRCALQREKVVADLARRLLVARKMLHKEQRAVQTRYARVQKHIEHQREELVGALQFNTKKQGINNNINESGKIMSYQNNRHFSVDNLKQSKCAPSKTRQTRTARTRTKNHRQCQYNCQWSTGRGQRCTVHRRRNHRRPQRARPKDLPRPRDRVRPPQPSTAPPLPRAAARG